MGKKQDGYTAMDDPTPKRGKIKEIIGKAIDDEELEAEGKADHAGGKVEEGFGKARRKVGEAIEDVGDAIKRGSMGSGSKFGGPPMKDADEARGKVFEKKESSKKPAKKG